jgi:glutathione synthase
MLRIFFLSSLWAIVLVLQPTSLGLFRSDYLLNCDSGTVKQVEINTIASSFGGISTHLGHFHR